LAESRRTRISVVGTPHLRSKGGVDEAALEPIRRRLEALRPDAIAVESLQPEVLGDMIGRGGIYAQVAEMFAGRWLPSSQQVQATLRMSPAEAQNAAERLLRQGAPADAAAHRLLASYFLAAYNFDSALLQWRWLSPAERRADGALTDALAKNLDDGLTWPSEDIQVALEVARRLGHQQLYPIDDQTDAILYNRFDEAFPGELEKIGKDPETTKAGRAPINLTSDSLLNLGKHDGTALLAEYAYVNSLPYTSADVDLQWGRYLRMHLASGVDRGRLAQWETRNLLIAAHVRAMSALFPGKRVLVLIGAAHKPFLEEYLGHAMDVRIIPFNNPIVNR
jgi:hypothetical protein